MVSQYKVSVSGDAESDLDGVFIWYELQKPGLGVGFARIINRSFSLIEQNPFLYQIIHKNIRRQLIKKFPYCIYYYIEGTSVRVIAVLHNSRNPLAWKKRR